ncbi:hypothetical protein EUTSA_v10017570mg [Eutrema salsugineum]|uniref:Protein kinase domain-containing protein n=1 Tax=Eutrema salsugineum TaxID=72664 RepID=V4MJH9_EUTSA|nr:mitogen-activated protein kinase kinase kinase 5 [Eutrema salsugineum]ESQ52778.1 hypothetical protein EUTSA_v10017570mg [Eutrema salsugineum]
MGEPSYVDESSLKTIRVLGKGAYGSVSLMVHPRDGLYAKKTSSIQFKENLEKELRVILRFRNHPRIVQASSDHLVTEHPSCYIYMEYACEGTLDKFISGFRGKPLPEFMIQSAVRMILQGLEALHSNGYVHCDIKPANVLIFPSTTLGEPWDLKLCDFGSCKEPNTDPAPLDGCTVVYMAPESFKFGPKGQIETCFDVWGLGCIAYQMFGGTPQQEFLEDYYEWKLNEEVSPVAKDFLTLCHAIPSRRPTVAQLLNHPFVTQSLDAPLPMPDHITIRRLANASRISPPVIR